MTPIFTSHKYGINNAQKNVQVQSPQADNGTPVAYIFHVRQLQIITFTRITFSCRWSEVSEAPEIKQAAEAGNKINFRLKLIGRRKFLLVTMN